ncbi:MAG: imidazoleglycerol-phosphate dehydratase HisB [Candidatus Omnitrophica bacterium]|nr:imidazoleglycerol-phosphate dehydratase HisB [Candidatus Omnitrophota bacterium]
MKKRKKKIQRKTKETNIAVELTIDGKGDSSIKTGIPFLDHMLTLFAKHGLFDLKIKAKGDLEVDIHHTNEDIGICLGQAFKEALGEKKGIRRFGEKTIPMDEALVNVRVVVDVSGRPFFNNIKSETPYEEKDVQGGYNLEYARQFFQAFVNSFPVTLHISILQASSDTHHLLEAIFKAAAKALDEATQIDLRVKGVPSTKGRL